MSIINTSGPRARAAPMDHIAPLKDQSRFVNERHAASLGPDGELIVGGGAKCVRRADQHVVAFALDAMCELAMVVVFRSVTPTIIIM